MSQTPASRQCEAVAAVAPRPPATAAWLLALLGWTVLICTYQLSGGSEFEVTDAWVAQTAREMHQSDSWRGYVVPSFCGETRIQKSPGPYWAVLLAGKLRGGGSRAEARAATTVDEVAVRIPNAIAAIAVVLTVFWLTRRIAGDRAAIFAGFATASSVMVLYWSHRGASDIGVAALMTLSLAALWIGSEVEPPGRKRIALWLLGYFAAGLAMLYKMPMPLVCVGLPVLLYVLLRNRWRVFRSGWHLIGLLLFLLPWLPWVIAVLVIEPTAWAKWKLEFWGRMTGEMPSVAPMISWEGYVLYVGVALLFAIPYSLSIPQALVRAFRRRPDVNRDGMLFLAIWFLSLLVFFTAAADKSSRYLLPAMPPLFALLGVELAAFFDPRRASDPRRDRVGLVAVCILVPIALLAGTIVFYREWYDEHLKDVFAWNEIWPPLVVTAAIFAAGAILSAFLYARRRENASFAALVGTMWLAWLWAWPMVMPKVAAQLPLRDFAEQLAELSPQQQAAIRQIGQQDPRVIWYSHVRYPRLIDQLELLRRQGGERSLENEIRIIGREMIRRLRGDDLALFVASADTYKLFRELREAESPGDELRMPETYPWLQARVGKPERRPVLFGNRPPPWPPPEIVLPEKLDHLGRRILRKAKAELATEATENGEGVGQAEAPPPSSVPSVAEDESPAKPLSTQPTTNPRGD